jgi:hypothetical protein
MEGYVMATNNNQGASEFKRAKITSKQSMDLYDALPKEYRDVLKESVMNLSFPEPKSIKKSYPTARHMKSWIRQKDLLGTRDTYGRNHPAVAYK